jgi:hypothetical protein
VVPFPALATSRPRLAPPTSLAEIVRTIVPGLGFNPESGRAVPIGHPWRDRRRGAVVRRAGLDLRAKAWPWVGVRPQRPRRPAWRLTGRDCPSHCPVADATRTLPDDTSRAGPKACDINPKECSCPIHERAAASTRLLTMISQPAGILGFRPSRTGPMSIIVTTFCGGSCSSSSSFSSSVAAQIGFCRQETAVATSNAPRRVRCDTGGVLGPPSRASPGRTVSASVVSASAVTLRRSLSRRGCVRQCALP